MPSNIAAVDGLEILNSRGNPTVQVTVTLSDGTRGKASVPSGASTSQSEAVELRDGDASRFGGLGVRHAIRNISERIRPALVGRDPTNQTEIDRVMIEIDGTANKSRLGANAILGVSIAVARAAALSNGMPLYRYLGGAQANRLPVPLMNVINGGKHAVNGLAFQEFMIVPHGAPVFSEALRWATETFHALRAILEGDGYSVSVGDEGGFAPELENGERVCELITDAIAEAGYEPGKQISIALDPAATSFYENGHYSVAFHDADTQSSESLLRLYATLARHYPILLIEDGFAETDWSAFEKQTELMGDRIVVVGDDLYATNPGLIRKGIARKATNAALIKLNQIGTLTETIEAIELCREAAWHFVISHRSGETVDDFIADFAVAMDGGLLKAGSLCRGERTAKYNRLLEIERELGRSARFSNPFLAAGGLERPIVDKPPRQIR